MPFLTKRLIVASIDPVNWAIQNDLIYAGEKELFKVPRGFVTDFASVPRFALWLVPVYGLYTKAAILHDWFCRFAIQAGIISARDADGIFRRIMREEGVPLVMRWLMWTAVRWAALLNPKRRAGWLCLKETPQLLLITLVAVPFLAPIFALVGLGLFLWELIESVLWLLGWIWKKVKR